MWRSRWREELDDLRAADRSRKQAEVEVPPRHPRHRRQHLPVEVILQHRRLSPWRPSAAAVRALAQSAFVDEDDGAPLFLGFFLISGQRCCFQRRILSSSRSSARPYRTLAAPAQLPQNPPGLRGVVLAPRIPARSDGPRATTSTSWFRNPAPRARVLTPRSMRRKSSGHKRALRPARPACFRARTPPCFNCSAQRLTDCRCTPTCRATSAGCTPWRNSRAPNSRRSSNF